MTALTNALDQMIADATRLRATLERMVPIQPLTLANELEEADEIKAHAMAAAYDRFVEHNDVFRLRAELTAIRACNIANFNKGI